MDPLIIAIAGVCGFFQLVPNGWIGLFMLIHVALRLYIHIDRSIIVLELAALIAILQCIIGPLLMYQSDYGHHRYLMYVDEGTYFSFAIPAIAAFVAALLLPIKGNRNLSLHILQSKQIDKLGWFLLAIALTAILATKFFPGAGFFLYLCGQFKYVAAICLFMSNNRYRWIVIIGVLLSGYLTAAEHGMFHELLIWTTFLAGFFFLQQKKSNIFKLATFAVAVTAILTIQGVKAEYREALHEGRDVNLLSMFNETLWSLGTVYANSDFQHVALTRMNQGWIISSVMRNVPASEPFAEGETIKTALYASVVPRFFDSRKATAGGRENFMRYTGLMIQDSTSMCIGTLGESYANFGIRGGIFTMLLLGLILNRIFAWFVMRGANNSYFLLCIPLVFLQAIKAETELLVILNHLTKSIFIVWIGYLILPRVFGVIKSPLRPRQRPTRTSGTKIKRASLVAGAKP
jgi:hypothetical protein